ncbi:hypothetical protein ScPMuIL_015918 [Solemya velum]
MNKHLQLLLQSEDYEICEDIVVVESYFIELIDGEPLRQVLLGLTPENFLVAERSLAAVKDDPRIVLQTETDTELEGLELVWLIPICFINLSIQQKYGRRILQVASPYSEYYKYYEPANIHETNKSIWEKWAYQISCIKKDPYGHISSLYEKCGLPYRQAYDQSEPGSFNAEKSDPNVERKRSSSASGETSDPNVERKRSSSASGETSDPHAQRSSSMQKNVDSNQIHDPSVHRTCLDMIDGQNNVVSDQRSDAGVNRRGSMAENSPPDENKREPETEEVGMVPALLNSVGIDINNLTEASYKFIDDTTTSTKELLEDLRRKIRESLPTTEQK